MTASVHLISDYRRWAERKRQQEREQCLRFLVAVLRLHHSGAPIAEWSDRLLAEGFTDAQADRFKFYIKTTPSLIEEAKQLSSATAEVSNVSA